MTTKKRRRSTTTPPPKNPPSAVSPGVAELYRQRALEEGWDPTAAEELLPGPDKPKVEWEPDITPAKKPGA